jgi:hypothetical protein
MRTSESLSSPFPFFLSLSQSNSSSNHPIQFQFQSHPCPNRSPAGFVGGQPGPSVSAAQHSLAHAHPVSAAAAAASPPPLGAGGGGGAAGGGVAGGAEAPLTAASHMASHFWRGELWGTWGFRIWDYRACGTAYRAVCLASRTVKRRSHKTLQSQAVVWGGLLLQCACLTSAQPCQSLLRRHPCGATRCAESSEFFSAAGHAAAAAAAAAGLSGAGQGAGGRPSGGGGALSFAVEEPGPLSHLQVLGN